MANFKNEAELFRWVQEHYRDFFGKRSIWIPREYCVYPGHTIRGAHRRPDAFVIDYAARRWYLVEVELIKHGIWRQKRKGILQPGHISDQLSVFASALRSPATIQSLPRKIASYIHANQFYDDLWSIVSYAEHENEPIENVLMRRTAWIIQDHLPVISVVIDRSNEKFIRDFSLYACSLNCFIDLYQVSKSSNGDVSSLNGHNPFCSFGPESSAGSTPVPSKYLKDTGQSIRDFEHVQLDDDTFWKCSHQEHEHEYTHFTEGEKSRTSPVHIFRVRLSLFDEIRKMVQQQPNPPEEVKEIVVLLLGSRWASFEFSDFLRMMDTVNARITDGVFEFYIDLWEGMLFSDEWENSVDIRDNLG